MEYVVKYHGEIRSLGFPVEILSSSYAIVETTPDQVGQILSFKEIEYIEPAKEMRLSMTNGLDSSCITSVWQANGYALSGAGVIIGIIDSGIDTAHPEFRNRDGTTRIFSLWDMTEHGLAPEGFYKGREYHSDAIDTGTVASRDVIGHGTAIAGIAAGKGGAAPEATIVAVKLGEAETRTTDAMRGIKYVIDQARRLGMPCVINLSYGTNNGSHRGQSLLESYIDDMSRQWKTVIVCAAGNEGYGGHHFHGRLVSGSVVKAEFTVAAHRSSMYLSLWKNFADTASYELLLPNGVSTGRITALSRRAGISSNGVNVTVVFVEPSHYSTAQEIYIQLGANDVLPDGVWTLNCYAETVVDGEFDVWLPMIDEVTDQTAFVTPDVGLTMTLPATAVTPISVGGYRTDTNTISSFSGKGGSVFGSGVSQLDLVAPAENIYTAKSGGGYDVFTGTSMAAPFVSGAAALMMEWGIVKGNDPFLYGQRVKAFLCKNAVRQSFLTYPNAAWGYGALSLCDALDDLAQYARRS